MKIHIVAIGGSVMHNLAICLKAKGHDVTGSDDEIFEPAKTRLNQNQLLPEEMGWHTKDINKNIDAVILGMHARADNPELLEAKRSGIKIYSYPEFVYEQSKNKKRIVIGGSHGKTTITAIILHTLKFWKYNFDYLIGAQLDGFDTMVNLTNQNPLIVIEGDEYLSSPIDKRPKFHLYKPHIALLSGIAWDHINVFPDHSNYIQQFKTFIDTIEVGGTMIYFNEDTILQKICQPSYEKLLFLPYTTPRYSITNGITSLISDGKNIQLGVFGKHNMQNIEGARLVCNCLGIDNEKFYGSIGSFKGAAKRLELMGESNSSAFYKDFAHSPSKLEATINALKEQFPARTLVACLELHTFSSLNKTFLNEYKKTMTNADAAIIYYNTNTLKHKKLPDIHIEDVKEAFAQPNLQVYTDSSKLTIDLKKINWKNKNLLMMSSGNFDGIDFNELKQYFC